MFPKLKQALRLLKEQIQFGNFAYQYHFLPIQKNKVVVSSYYGRGYSDNPKAIVAELLDQGLDIVWLVQNGEEKTLPAGVRHVPYGSKQALRELATAKIWLDNCRQKFSPPKRRSQIYIQTWHGPYALKKVEKDAEEQLPISYVKRAKKNARKCDYMLSGSAFCDAMYTDTFWFQGEVLPIGTPRCDVFFQDNAAIHQRVTQFFQTEATARFVTYAPTFRTDGDATVYLQDFTEVQQALQHKYGGTWKVLLRLHPNVAELAKDIDYGENVLNATAYPDMQELLAASDLLITDYSSSMFDMMIAEKKVMLYAPDLASYLKNERALYFDLKNLPFPLSETQTDLVSQITQFDETNYKQQLHHFQQQFGQHETGTASARIANQIKNWTK
ncbi:glycerophosphotransferase [Listeria booriae]|uniref:Glycerophosphotransferase n=1 Tax=Listeria booriae TaxID=1552123 RepID=A0A842AWB1_9LIST|nr:CDP-glycerol glycerophosphotransferase family protein [Listeria booriae]MBC1797023.1 glycerophosphotransferase [Listeria booriae]MBC1813093.1 glycerophosphotransferase [Listeria booriae]